MTPGPSGEVLVRLARADDAEGLAAVYGPLVADTTVSFEDVPPTAEEMGRRLAGLAPGHPWLVAEQAGTVLGFAYALPFRSRAAYAWTAETSVYLAPEARGRGVGRMIMDALLNLLTAQGFRTVIAVVALPNAASLALHHALGFADRGTIHRVGFKLGSWIDVSFLELHLLGSDQPIAAPRPVGELAEAELRRCFPA